MGGGRLREVVAHGGSTVFGDLIYLRLALSQEEYHDTPRSLRSSSKSSFTDPTVKSVTYGERGFSFCHLHYGILFSILLKVLTLFRPLNLS